VNADQPLLVKAADGFLEVALADPEMRGNQLGRSPTAHREAETAKAHRG